MGRAAPAHGSALKPAEVNWISERCLELQSITHVTRHTIKINQPIHITLHRLFGWEQPKKPTNSHVTDMVTDMRHGILYEVKHTK